MSANQDDSKSKDNPLDGMPNLGGLFDGMAGLLGKLGELAEKGEHLRKSGNFPIQGGKDIQGSYGFSVKLGPGGTRSDEINVQPTKTAETQAKAALKKPPAPEDREPQVDVFHEDDHILVIAEMPGVAVENITAIFAERKMNLIGNSTRVRFRKEFELPYDFSPENVDISVNNGMVEIRLQLKTPGQAS